MPAELLSVTCVSLRPCGCRELHLNCPSHVRQHGCCTSAPVWLQVRSSGGQQSPFYAELEAAQSAAEASGLGIWSKVSQGTS